MPMLHTYPLSLTRVRGWSWDILDLQMQVPGGETRQSFLEEIDMTRDADEGALRRLLTPRAWDCTIMWDSMGPVSVSR